MSFIGRMFGRIDALRDDEPPSMPWDRRPSILEFVRSQIAGDKPGVMEGGESLPDNARLNKCFRLHWTLRAIDGIAINSVSKRESRDKVKATLDLISAYTKEPTAINKELIYQHIVDGQVCSNIDPVILAVQNKIGINRFRLYDLAYSFVTESPDREPVKFGIAILALFREQTNEDLFVTLGHHEEFTLFIATALAHDFDDHEATLWKLARNGTGWGRIQLVKRLAKTENPEIKKWLLREGFRNSVQSNYLAGTCARAGDLLSALREDCVDRELLNSAGEIIQALIDGGPADGIDDYEDGAGVIQSYVAHMGVCAETCGDFLHLTSILEFLNQDRSKWRIREARGWNTVIRASLKYQCNVILSRPEWHERVRAALDCPDEATFDSANQAAIALGVNTWSFHWKRLQEMPANADRWMWVMRLCNAENISALIQFAEENLDLDWIKSDTDNEPMIYPRSARYTCLDYVLQKLHRFPGQGKALISAALKSPSMRNRTTAVVALAASARDKWPIGIHDTLRVAAILEPDQGLRRAMRMVLGGESLD